MPSEADLVWAAGLFEGEGSFSWQAPDKSVHRGANVRACLSMTDWEPVARFASIVGVGAMRLKPARCERHKDQVMWRVTNRAGVQTVLDLLSPWLCERRRSRGQEVLRLQAENMSPSRVPKDSRGRFKLEQTLKGMDE
jgi:hypothetical protein